MLLLITNGGFMLRMETQKETLAEWTHFMPESEIRRLLAVNKPYYFAGGKPGVFGYESIIHILRELADKYEQELQATPPSHSEFITDFNYGLSLGELSLRKVLANREKRIDNLNYKPENIVITTGSQQTLAGIIDTITNPGDIILAARPTYLGFLLPAVKLQTDVITIDQDQTGLITDDLESLLEILDRRAELNKLKLLYIVADSDNPKGTTIPESRRKKLFDLAETYDFYILEDSAYREIQFGTIYPTIKSYDKENKRVIYSRSTSKEMAPIRLGYSIMPDNIKEEFAKWKGYYDLNTPVFTQKIAELYYRDHIDKVLPNICAVYKHRAELMGQIMDEYFPEGQRTYPQGGFFIWFETAKKSFNATTFLEKVGIPNDVVYVPGSSFYPIRGHAFNPEVSTTTIQDNIIMKNTMRISYSLNDDKTIEDGIKRLGQILTKELH